MRDSLIRPIPRSAEAHWCRSAIRPEVVFKDEPATTPRTVTVTRRLKVRDAGRVYAFPAPVRVVSLGPSLDPSKRGSTRRRAAYTEQSDEPFLAHMLAEGQASETPENTP